MRGVRRALPLLATLAGVGLFMRLGWWQYTKALQAEAAVALHAQSSLLPPAPLDGRLVQAPLAEAVRFTVRGRYEAAQQFFIDNRQERGVPGVHVITPLKIDGSDTRLLVNRGWVGWPQGRGVLPQVPVPEGPLQITGTAQTPSAKRPFLMPDRPEPSQRLRARVEIERYAAAAQQVVQPVVLLQDAADPADGLVRNWPAPEDRSVQHWGYAWQWFGMAAALLLFHMVAALGGRARRG
jgi:surfeit locus 1 family protein